MEQVPTDSSQAVDQAQSATPTQTSQPNPTVETSQSAPVVSPESPKRAFLKPLLIVVFLGILAGGIGILYTQIKGDRSEVRNGQRGTSIPPAIPLTSTPQLGISISENFEGATLNEELWSPWKLSERNRVELKDGKIQVEIPPGITEYSASGLNFLPQIEGDFEVTVEATILAGGYPGGSGSALVFHSEEGDLTNQLSILLMKEEGGTSLKTAIEVNGEYENLDFVKLYDHSGPFTIRMTRNKGKVTFSVKEGSEFITLGTLSSGFYQGKGIITLHVNTYGENFPAVLSTFDNFSLRHL